MKKKKLFKILERNHIFDLIGTAVSIAAFSGVLIGKYLLADIGKVNYSPVEDLITEHGVLSRALAIYEECIQRLNNKEYVDTGLILTTTEIIHNFISYHHEILEEKYIFPRFEAAGKHLDLIRILNNQHNIGKSITDKILRLCNKDTLKHYDRRNNLIDLMQETINLMRPHMDKENTELFPDFEDVVSTSEFYDLGEKFEYIEHEKFGKDGFKKILEKISDIEKTLGIYYLPFNNPEI